MTLPHFHYNPNQEPPFTIYIEHRDKTRDGHWRPAAFVKLSSELRTSGFLSALPPEDLKTFLLLLSFVAPSGRCASSLPQLASALRQSEARTRARMERLTGARWHDQPLVLPARHGNGLEAYTLTPGLLPIQEEPVPTASPPSGTPYTAAPREAVIAFSRERYARPRAQVERQIAQLNGWEVPEEPEPEKLEPAHLKSAHGAEPPATETPPIAHAAAVPAAASPSDSAASGLSNAPADVPVASLGQQKVAPSLRRRLKNCGLTREQTEKLLTAYSRERIERQLEWLPFRNAKNPAAYLVVAIEKNYEQPRMLHGQKAAMPIPSPQISDAPTPDTNR